LLVSGLKRKFWHHLTDQRRLCTTLL